MDYIKGDRNAVFVELLTQNQRKLYGFIYSLVPNSSDADDILQETNIVLWNKNFEYQLGTNFMTWACRIAFLKVKNFLRTKNRSRLYFNEKLLSELSDMRIDRTELHTIHSMLLINCLEKLPLKSRELLKLRYDGNHSIQEVAKQMGRPVGSLYNTLSQIRLKLWECIRFALTEEGSL
ncbi:MAG: sigma-70 family RNA polymerase sigma factor [Thermoguttaceae bacterium]